MNVLVLGVGGNVSQGILKAIALSKIPTRIIGACVSPRAFGLFTVDKAYVSPFANEEAFIPWLFDICRKESVDAVLSGVEQVLSVLSVIAPRIRDETGAVCVVASPECLNITEDKLHTCRWLETHGFAFPRYADTASAEDVWRLVSSVGFPLVAKPRRGKSGRGVLEIQDDETLSAAIRLPNYILQEHLGSSEEEYTVGCFNDVGRKTRGAIVLRRDLLGGTTFRAEAGEFPEVRKEAVQIAQTLGCTGPSNIQLRLHRGRPTCFEINLRFSGTTSIRARLGFNDVAAALQHLVLGKPAVDLPMVTSGIAVRYWNEAYPRLDDVAELELFNELRGASRASALIEDYGILR